MNAVLSRQVFHFFPRFRGCDTRTHDTQTPDPPIHDGFVTEASLAGEERVKEAGESASGFEEEEAWGERPRGERFPGGTAANRGRKRPVQRQCLGGRRRPPEARRCEKAGSSYPYRERPIRPRMLPSRSRQGVFKGKTGGGGFIFSRGRGSQVSRPRRSPRVRPATQRKKT